MDEISTLAKDSIAMINYLMNNLEFNILENHMIFNKETILERSHEIFKNKYNPKMLPRYYIEEYMAFLS